MWQWIKKNSSIIITLTVTVGFLIFLYSCDVKTMSLVDDKKQVTRQGLQLELDQLIDLAQLRMADLDKQEQFRNIILQNALILVQGQPFNPVGLITGVAALYGLTQAGSNVTKVVKKAKTKGKQDNGTT